MASPLWEQALSPADRATLGEAGPEALPSTPDVLVVGGGIVGVATAAMCVRDGLGSVVLIERDRLGAGATGGAVGLLSPDPHRIAVARDLLELGASSLARYQELRAEWGLDLQPVDLVLPPGPDGHAAIARDQAQVNPLRLTAQLARHAGVVATGVEMTSIEVQWGRVARVRTTRGDVRPGVVVLATGLAPDWLPEVPQFRVKGHVIATEPAGFRLPLAVTGEDGAVWQLEDGTLIFGGTVDAGDRSPHIREDVVVRMRRELDLLVPRAAGLRVAHRWCCFRPATTDGLPVLDHVPGIANAWAAIGFYRSGLVLAAAAGAAMASWIATGTQPGEIAAFGVGRAGHSTAV